MKELIDIAILAALEAGERINEIYQGHISVELKEDNSPLTQADKAAHQVIVSKLSATKLPVLSEEGKSIPYQTRRRWKRFWLVDPLDGTKEFIKRNGDFTVNIALIEDNKPVAGVIYVPVMKKLLWGSPEGSFMAGNVSAESYDSSKQDWVKLPADERKGAFRIVASRSHLSAETTAFIEEQEREHGKVELLSLGSSLKLALVAEGKADVYPRLAPTMEWDTAAGHAIAKYAGCSVREYASGNELAYNKENLLNPWFIVVRNAAEPGTNH